MINLSNIKYISLECSYVNISFFGDTDYNYTVKFNRQISSLHRVKQKEIFFQSKISLKQPMVIAAEGKLHHANPGDPYP